MDQRERNSLDRYITGNYGEDQFRDREDDEDEAEDRCDFADPGGNSALRAASKDNPRNLSCPQCGQRNKLTPADRALGYCCDQCANHNEGSGPDGNGDY